MTSDQRIRFRFLAAAALLLSLLVAARMLTVPAPQALAAGPATEARQPLLRATPPARAAKPQPRIVGGTPVPVGQYRFMTYITWFGGQLCGGALIAPQFVLTAAHCMEGRSAEDLGLYVGGNIRGVDGIPQGSIARNAVAVTIDPRYDSNVSERYDAAVITLDQPIPPASQGGIDPLPFVSSGSSVGGAGTWLTVAGWGATSFQGPSSSQLLEVDVQVQGDSTCSSIYSSSFDPATMFCAGPLAGGEDSCQGDSGGPIFLDSGGGQIEVGIVSWGVGCASPGFPGVYARLANSEINDFINIVLGNPIPTPTPTPDSSGPTVRITRPASGSNVTAPFTVRVSATDPSGVRRVALQECERGACRTIDAATTPPWSFRIDPGSGKTVLRAVATDRKGNSRTSPKVKVTVR